MTFLQKLKRLMDAATDDRPWWKKYESRVKCGEYLINHAPALAELVESVAQEHGGNHHEPECPICIAYAKLNANDTNNSNDGGKHEG